VKGIPHGSARPILQVGRQLFLELKRRFENRKGEIEAIQQNSVLLQSDLEG
jgi:hypothetical protein